MSRPHNQQPSNGQSGLTNDTTPVTILGPVPSNVYYLVSQVTLHNPTVGAVVGILTRVRGASTFQILRLSLAAFTVGSTAALAPNGIVLQTGDTLQVVMTGTVDPECVWDVAWTTSDPP